MAAAALSLFLIIHYRYDRSSAESATGRNIRLEAAPAVDLEALCRSIGVQSIYTVDPADTDASRKVIAQAMKEPHVTL
jgi:indolepyruvate ferredoxin oxidoreductase alpha subunit